MTGYSPGKRVGGALAVTVFLALLAGCGGGRAIGTRTEFIPFTPEQQTVLQVDSAQHYRIQEGDLLRVRFAYERSLDQEGIIVLSDGSVNLIGIDRVRVAGLTLAEADSVLTESYSREYREPTLSVMIQDTKGRRVYVLGEVRYPGLYPVPLGGSDVISAIALANGFSENAAPEGTVVVRVTPNGYQFQEIDLSDFRKSRIQRCGNRASAAVRHRVCPAVQNRELRLLRTNGADRSVADNADGLRRLQRGE